MALLLTAAILGVITAAHPIAGQQVLGRAEKFQDQEAVLLKQTAAGPPVIPQREWRSFPNVGLATFSAYRVRRDMYVVLAMVHRSRLVATELKEWFLTEKDISCSLRTREEEDASRPEDRSGTLEGRILKGTLFADARIDVYHEGEWVFVALFCKVRGAPPSGAYGTFGQVLHVHIGTQVISAEPEDATPPGPDTPWQRHKVLSDAGGGDAGTGTGSARGVQPVMEEVVTVDATAAASEPSSGKGKELAGSRHQRSNPENGHFWPDGGENAGSDGYRRRRLLQYSLSVWGSTPLQQQLSSGTVEASQGAGMRHMRLSEKGPSSGTVEASQGGQVRHTGLSKRVPSSGRVEASQGAGLRHMRLSEGVPSSGREEGAELPHLGLSERGPLRDPVQGGSLENALGGAGAHRRRLQMHSPDSGTTFPVGPRGPHGAARRQLLNFCGTPIFGGSPLRVVKEWVVYHQHAIGFDHLYFYMIQDNMNELRDVLLGTLSLSEFTIVDYRRSEDYPSWAHAQTLALNDCLHWNRRRAQWIALCDFDEYIHVANLPPFNSLRYFLTFNATGCSEVNRASYFFGLFCNGTLRDPNSDVMAAELLEYKPYHPHCLANLRLHRFKSFNFSHCTDWWGHRKGFVRTDDVYLGLVHTIDFPPFSVESFPSFYQCNMSAHDIYNAHYSGFGLANATCLELPQNATSKYHRTREVADVAKEARLCRSSTEGRNCQSPMWI